MRRVDFTPALLLLLVAPLFGEQPPTPSPFTTIAIPSFIISTCIPMAA